MCSQEIRDSSPVGHGALFVIDSIEDVELSFHILVNVQDRSNVSATVTVVRGGPNCYQVIVSEPELEPIHNELMCACDQIQVVNVIEFSGHS